MNIANGEYKCSAILSFSVARILTVAGFFLLAFGSRAQLLPPSGGGGTKYVPLNSWSFTDTNGWTSDAGTSPVSFTNVSGLFFGDENSLIVNSTNPAWAQYNVIETNGATNLTLDVGSVFFWFAPNWSSADQGGTGPNVLGRLVEVGHYTSDGSGGWWSLLTDTGGTNLYFMVQPGDGSTTTYLQTPISWISNYWHCITITYCSTNTALYLDGSALVTNGPGITAWPGTNVTVGGFFIGSDGGSSGLLQAQGAFDDLYTYNVPLDGDAVYHLYQNFYPDYYLTPNNYFFVANIISAPSNPSTNTVTPDVITGAGDLQWVGTAAPVYSTNAYTVWITNVTAAVQSDGSMNITFTIQGGLPGYYYDTFASGALGTGAAWYWMGQGTNSGIYTLNVVATDAYLMLGTPQDSDGDGLTDAYELLISHTDPHNPYSNSDGVLDGWDILLGLNPKINNFTSPNQRSNYGYTTADWLNGVTGIRGGTITTDNEGNVQTVSQ